MIFSYLADFSAEFHDIRGAGFLICSDSESYVASQELAEQLLEAGSIDVVYPSVRKPEGTCLACFRPALVTNVRQGRAYLFRWDGKAEPIVTGRLGDRKRHRVMGITACDACLLHNSSIRRYDLG